MSTRRHTAWYVVPCGAAKLDRPAAAEDLYRGGHFRYVLNGVKAHAQRFADLTGRPTRVLIMSALHGLLMPGQMIAPYDVTLRDAASITAHALANTALVQGIAHGDTVTTFLPIAYRVRLETALGTYIDPDLATEDFTNAYARCSGIGDHRGVIARLAGLTDAQITAGNLR